MVIQESQLQTIAPPSYDDTVLEKNIEDEDTATPKRETWARKIDFLLACVGFSVGLGNVWRFPYLCYRNGGGAFLIPYLICVVIGGIPVFLLEVSLGQFMSEGGIKAWNICPLFRGIGLATTIIVFLLNCYYNVILSWAFYYVFASFTDELPWKNCGHEWNTNNCSSFTERGEKINETLGSNMTTVFNETLLVNSTLTVNTSNSRGSTWHSGYDPVVEFWERKVLAISSGLEEPGVIKWDLILCLLLAWLVVYFCIWKGVKTSGKLSYTCHTLAIYISVMYFTATSPYILMFCLLIRGCTLPGAGDGIIYYIKPNFTRMADAKVWVDAGTQIFFSYSLGLGTLTALGSYNLFNHNSYKDCMIFAAINSGTSIFAGFVIFSTLGYMAHLQNTDVGSVAESGPGLAFIAYPKALAAMPVLAPVFSVVFFLMVILLGLDSQFVGVEGFITAVSDLFPKTMRRGYNREIFIGISCFACFLVGISMVTQGGMFVFQIFDHYSGSRIILLVALFECITIGYVYGLYIYSALV